MFNNGMGVVRVKRATNTHVTLQEIIVNVLC